MLPAAHRESCRHQHTASAAVSMPHLQFTCYTLSTTYSYAQDSPDLQSLLLVLDNAVCDGIMPPTHSPLLLPIVRVESGLMQVLTIIGIIVGVVFLVLVRMSHLFW